MPRAHSGNFNDLARKRKAISLARNGSSVGPAVAARLGMGVDQKKSFKSVAERRDLSSLTNFQAREGSGGLSW